MSDHTGWRGLGFRLLGGALLTGLLYPLSLGPACWTLSWFQWEMRYPELTRAVSWVYCPLAPVVVDGPEPVRRALKCWMRAGMPARTEFHGDWSRGVGWSNPGYTFTLWHY
jgi:hypothetical protein